MSLVFGSTLTVVYILLVFTPLITAAAVMLPPEKEFLIEAAKGLALTSFMILMLQPVLAGRFKLIEKPFGLDILLRFHKYMAVFATLMLLLHPLGMASEHGLALLYKPNIPWQVWFGRSALAVLLLSMLFNIGMITRYLSFERWRLIHDILNPLLLTLIFIHSFFIGTDLKAKPMKVLWILVFGTAAAAFIYHRFIRPWLLNRIRYTVSEVIEEAPEVHTLKFVPPKGQVIFPYLPGQFHFITLHRKSGLPEEEHHFTISSSPDRKDYISSTIKNLGDFTATIGQTEKGDKATIHGPFGRFSYTLHPGDRDLVFIAGGIGITPLMSMLRYMVDTEDKRPVTLFYANRDKENIVFRKELEEITADRSVNLTLVNILKDPGEDWQGETGHLNRDIITKYCGRDLAGKTFYLCGPPGLIKTMLEVLQDLKIPKKNIRTEIFSFVN